MKQGYLVYVDDNFHFMDEDEPSLLGEYAHYEDALAVARGVVERFFAAHEPGCDAEALYEAYTSFGDDPFIVAFGGAPEPVTGFSAWDYAKVLTEALARQPRDKGPSTSPPPTRMTPGSQSAWKGAHNAGLDSA